MQESITNPAFHYYFSALPQPALIDTRLKDRDRRLLAAFYLIAGRGNVIYNKTRKELGRLAGMAEDVVTRISTRLVQFGWLKKSGNGGRSQSAVYELIVPDQFTHLQRPINQKCSINTTQQPPIPVVSKKTSGTQQTALPAKKLVTSSYTASASIQDKNDKSYPLSLSLDYPNGLDPSFAHSLLIQLPDTQQQVALDEWLGQVTSYKERSISIHSPNGLFRTIIKALLAGHPAQHAASVKQRRERAKLIAKSIETPPQRENEALKPSRSSTKRFAPGELKAKLMEGVLKLKATEQSQNPAIAPQKTLYTEAGLSKENPAHLLRAHINTQPTKNIKTTTTVVNEAGQEKVDEVPENRGGGDLKHYPGKPLNHSLQTKEKLEGVGSLADDQTQPSTLLTKLTSAHEFVDEPSAQGVGRGQSLVGDSPPHPLSPTSFTRPDALRLPNQINNFSKPSKPDYAQEAPNDTQHGSVSSETDAGTHQKMPAGRDGGQCQKGYQDLSHRQRTGFTDQTGNRTKNAVNPNLGDLIDSFFTLKNLSNAIKKWCRHGSRRKKLIMRKITSFFKNIPLQLHISYLFVFLIVIFAAISNSIEYYQMRQSLLMEAQEKVERFKQSVTFELKNLYKNNELLLSILSRQAFKNHYSVDWYLERLHLFAATLENMPTLSAFYIGFEEGSTFMLRPIDASVEKLFRAPKGTAWLVQSRQQQQTGEWLFFDYRLQLIEKRRVPEWNYDPRQRPWYRDTWKQKQAIAVTDPYLDFSTKEPTVTFAKQLPHNLGVMGIDTDLSTIEALLKHADITDHSELALLNANSRVISWYGGEAQPPLSMMDLKSGLPRLSELPSPVLATFYHDWRQPGVTASHRVFEVKDKHWQGELVPLTVNDRVHFNLLLASPFDELLADAVDRQKTLLLVSVGVVLFGIAIALLFARIAARPLRALMIEARKIERFDFAEPIRVTSNILEITQLALAMDRMKTTIHRFMDMSQALSEKTHFPALLTSILHDTQASSEAQGGVIYLAENEERTLFSPVQAAWKDQLTDQVNDVSSIHVSSASEHPVSSMLLANQKQRELDKDSLAQWFGHLPASRDKVTLLVISLSSRKRERMGLLVLFVDTSRNSVTPERLAFTEAVAQSAAVALYTQHLLMQQKTLLSAFIEVMAGAIDAKSTHTGWHCRRLPVIAEMLAQAACDETEGPLANFQLDEFGWETLRTAAWLHDCGKVTMPEYVIDKGVKLETLYNRLHEIRMRFEVLKRDAEIACLRAIAQGADPHVEEETCQSLHQTLLEEYLFIAECNIGGEAMSDEAISRLNDIAERRWLRTLPDDVGLSEEESYRKGPSLPLPVEEKLLADKPEHRIERPASQIIPNDNPWGFRLEVPAYLYDHGEVHNLSVRRGTITPEERYKINEHIIQTTLMLDKLPFPDTLKRVPEIAVNHHERVDGKGYPRRLTGMQMSVEAKIMAIADIFEALTAADRPYKKGKMLSETLDIMRRMSETGHIDRDLFNLFVRSEVYLRYAKEFMKPEQIDDVKS